MISANFYFRKGTLLTGKTSDIEVFIFIKK